MLLLLLLLPRASYAIDMHRLRLLLLLLLLCLFSCRPCCCLFYCRDSTHARCCRLETLCQRGLLHRAGLLLCMLGPPSGQRFNQLFLDGPGEGRQHRGIHLHGARRRRAIRAMDLVTNTYR